MTTSYKGGSDTYKKPKKGPNRLTRPWTHFRRHNLWVKLEVVVIVDSHHRHPTTQQWSQKQNHGDRLVDHSRVSDLVPADEVDEKAVPRTSNRPAKRG